MKNDDALTFHHLTYLQEGDEITIGRPDYGTYAVFPADGAALLQQLQAGLSPVRSSQWYYQTYGEVADIDAFLETLRELHFLREKDTEAPALPVATWQWLGQAVFSLPAWLLYFALFTWCLYDIVHFPVLRPTYQWIFFSPYLTLVEATILFGQIPAILFHELYHILAARRLGVPSRLGIGRRFYFVVMQTSLEGLWGVPRRSRYLPFLAGMLADTIVFALLIIGAGLTLTPGGALTLPGKICVAFALTTIFRFLWQFNLYLRTDVYYVCANLFKCIDLQATTFRYMHNQWFRLIGRTDKRADECAWNPRDRQVARWYAPLMVLGYLYATVVGLFALVPILAQVAGAIFTHVFKNATLNSGLFWDSLLALLLNGLQLAVALGLYLRERRLQRLSHTSSVS
ncbi:MAG TPA: hypothetical protein VFV38_00860 [Ktedonobacteraceae bacterium]|nr:hypothetical protein [Ktedonobacteraceae bacterium]